MSGDPIEQRDRHTPGMLSRGDERQKAQLAGSRLEPGLRIMVATLASQINARGFRAGMAWAMAIR